MQAVQTARDRHIMLLLENGLRYFTFCLDALPPGITVDGITFLFIEPDRAMMKGRQNRSAHCTWDTRLRRVKALRLVPANACRAAQPWRCRWRRGRSGAKAYAQAASAPPLRAACERNAAYR